MLHKIFKKHRPVSRTLVLLLILSLSIHHAQGISAVYSFIASETLKYVCCRVIPGLSSAMIAQNIANMSLNIASCLKLPTTTIEILNNTNNVTIALQATQSVTPVAARTTIHQALDLCKSHHETALRCSQPLFPNISSIVGTSGKPIITNVSGNLGRNAFCAITPSCTFAKTPIPKISDYIGLNATIDGKPVFNKTGASSFSFGIDMKTSKAPCSSMARYMAHVAQLNRDRISVYNRLDEIGSSIPDAQQFTSTIKPLITRVENRLIEAINHTPSLIQTGDILIELKTIENYCVTQMNEIEILNHQNLLPPAEARGLYSLLDETRRTVRNMQGVFCDSSGNIIGLGDSDRQQQLGRIFRGHCERINYNDELKAQKISQITEPIAASVRSAYVSVPELLPTSFNEDLTATIHHMQTGSLNQAQAIIGKYDPTRFWHFSNWRNNRYELHDTMQRAYRECLEEWYTPDGILKAYEIHPLWPELQEALQQYPELKAQIIDKLRNESAFCTQQLRRIGIHKATEHHMQQIYKMLQYIDLKNFEQHLNNMHRFADLPKTLENCMREQVVENRLKELNISESIANHLMREPDIVQSVMFDPHFKAIIQDGNTNAQGLIERLQFLTERRDATLALMNRLQINDPNNLTTTLCYHLLDNYHDTSRMLDILLELDPYHVDPLVRQAYADFFDARGLQKVLPINDQIYNLWQERMGTAVDVTSNSTLRDAYNRLTAIQTNSPTELRIIDRGLTYLELGQTQHPTAPFMREYAEQYIKALTNPSGEHRNALAVADIVDAFSQPEARSLAHVGLNRLSGILNSTTPSSPDNQQLLGDLRSVAEHIRNNNIRKAQRHLYTLPLKPAASAATSSSHIATEAQHVTQDTSLHSTTTGATSNRSIEACPPQLIDFAHAVACAQKHIQGISTLLTLADGILVTVNHNTAAFASFDGYVDMLHHRNSFAKCFTQDMRRVAQYAGPHALNRSRILEHAERSGFDISCCCPENGRIVPVSSGGCIGSAYPEIPPDGCGIDTYNAGESNREFSDCGTGSIDLRDEPYVGAPNPVYEQLEKARIEREQEASRVLRHIRDRSTTVKHAAAACNPIHRSHPTSGIKYPVTQPLVRAFDADADSGQRASSSAAGLVAGLQHILVDNKIDITKIDLDNLPQHLYDEAICSGDKLQQWVKQFKSTPGALGKDGPLQKLLEMGYVGASPGCQSAARGALYELKAARELENKGEYIISFGSKNIKNCPRDIDIITTSKFIECKDINWNSLNSSRVNKIMSDLPQFKKIATEHGKIFEFHSKQPIPKPIADWLIDKNINFIEG